MLRQPDSTFDDIAPDDIVWKPSALMEQPTGLDLVTSPTQVNPNLAIDIKNFRINDAGKLQARYALSQLGAVSSNKILGTVTYYDNAGTARIYRWTSTTVEFWSGSSWTALTGPAFAIPANIRVSSVPWGSFLLFADYNTGILKINPSANTYTLITGSPICKKITTFGNRVLASGIQNLPSRIQWCAKNNSDDWTGLGSGYEDLAATPGISADTQYQVFPLNDTEAFAARSGSIWLMGLTGDVNAPFSFRFLHQAPSDAPDTYAASPYGLFFVGRDNVFLATTSSLNPIGDRVRPGVFVSGPDFTAACGTYNFWLKEYLLVMPSTTAPSGNSDIFSYKAPAQAWIKYNVAPRVGGFGSSSFRIAQTIDQLVGTINSLVGTIDSLGGAQNLTYGITFYDYSAGGGVWIEDESATDAALSCSFDTTMLHQDPLKSIVLHRAGVEIDKGKALSPTLNVSYSSDEFSNTILYGSRVITRTVLARSVKGFVKQEVSLQQLQLRFELVGCPGIILNRALIHESTGQDLFQ